MVEIKRTLLLLVATLSLHAFAQEMTLAECIQVGIERNLQLRNNRIDVAKGEMQISQSRAMLLPTVNGTFQVTGYLKNPVQVSGGTLIDMDYPDPLQWQKVHTMPIGSTLAVTAQAPLYNKSIFAAIEAAKVIKELNLLSVDKAREQLIVQIAQTYFGAQAYRELEILFEADINRMKTLHAITKSMYEQGVILEIDYTRIGINITNLEAQRNSCHTAHIQQLNTLRFLLDMKAEDPIEVERMRDDLFRINAQSMSPLLPDLQLADTQITLIDKQKRLTKAGYLPSVGAFVQGGFLGYQERLGDLFTKFNKRQFGMAAIGVSVSIPIFDGRDRSFKLKQYDYDAEKAVNNRQLLQSNLEREHNNSLLQLNQNEQIFTTQTANRKQAFDVYQITELRYREGITPMSDLLQDDMRLITAEQEIVTAHLQYNLALVGLLRLEGQLDLLNKF